MIVSQASLVMTLAIVKKVKRIEQSKHFYSRLEYLFRFLGRFLWGRTVNEKYSTKLNLNSVNLLKSGSFSVEFWAMLWCEGGNECAYADDSIKLTLDDLSGNGPIQFQVNYGNIRQQKSWQRFNFAFTSQKSSALVRKITLVILVFFFHSTFFYSRLLFISNVNKEIHRQLILVLIISLLEIFKYE